MINKNLWIFNHYAQGPDLPGGTRHYDLSMELKEKGYSITIFASGYHHALLKDVVNYNDKGYFIEDKDGVRFVWVKTEPYKKNGLKRIINIISYIMRLNYVIPKLSLEKPDFILGSTVHPFAGLIAKKTAKKFGSKFIFEIRDLWPQTFIDMGIWSRKSITSKIFKYIEKITVNGSSKIIVLSPLTIDYLKNEYNYIKDDILLLPNGVNKNFINKNITQGSKDDINITYLGGIDSVHGLDYLIHLAKEVKNKNITFNIYGEGKEKENLIRLMLKNNVKNIKWHSSVPKYQVPQILGKATVLFVSTSNVLYGSENKLFDYMASGKPIALAIRGDHNDPVKEIGCGITLDRDDVLASSFKLEEYLNKEFDSFLEIGTKGQDYVIKNRTIDILSNKLDVFFKSI